MNRQERDIFYMRRALELAKYGIGLVAPNPMVGTIIVKGDRIIAEGWHKVYGENHAEIEALNNATEELSGSTLYVTLEPCSHFGKTPPCTQAIIENQIKRVVIAMVDPNPLVAGNGIKQLIKAGIEVECGVEAAAAKDLNRAFIKHITTGIPWVTIKTATTADGKIATHTGSSKWITNEESRKIVHQLRHEQSAIMTGISTVKADNPQLNCRLDRPQVKHPIRIILDSNIELSVDSCIALTAHAQQTYLAYTNPDDAKLKQLKHLGIETIECNLSGKRIDLNHLLYELGKRGINSVLVEAGGTLNASLIEQRLADEMILFIAPKIVGGVNSPTCVEGIGVETMNLATQLTLKEVQCIGSDILARYQFDNHTCNQAE